MYFHTNCSPIHSGVRLPVLVNNLLVIPSCTDHYRSKRSENVKTVQVSGHFGIILSTESALNGMLLNTGTGVKAVVLRNNKQYLLKKLVNIKP